MTPDPSLCDACAVISSFPNLFPFADLRAMIFFRSSMLFSALSSVAAVVVPAVIAEISVSGWQVVNVVLSIVDDIVDGEMNGSCSLLE